LKNHSNKLLKVILREYIWTKSFVMKIYGL